MKKIKLVVCDDELVQRKFLGVLLERFFKERKIPVEISYYGSGEEFLENKEQDLNLTDLFLLDIFMPNLNGIELAREIKERNAPGKIIFITGGNDYVTEAFELKAFSYIQKPVEYEKFSKVLSHALESVEKIKFMEVMVDREVERIYLKDIEYVENSEYILKFTPYKNGNKMGDEIHLKISGKANIANAIAAIAVVDKNNIEYMYIKKGLEEFTGASRRFEYKGMVNGARIYDDYAHHPTEIKALSEGISHIPVNRKIAIFEPHTYSRVINHKEDFAKSLSNFDIIIATKIYASREVNKHGITSEEITNILKENK